MLEVTNVTLNGLAKNKRQASIWTNANPIYLRIYAALWGDIWMWCVIKKNENRNINIFKITHRFFLLKTYQLFRYSRMLEVTNVTLNGLAKNKRQASIWTNANPIYLRIYAALWGDIWMWCVIKKNENRNINIFKITHRLFLLKTYQLFRYSSMLAVTNGTLEKVFNLISWHKQRYMPLIHENFQNKYMTTAKLCKRKPCEYLKKLSQ